MHLVSVHNNLPDQLVLPSHDYSFSHPTNCFNEARTASGKQLLLRAAINQIHCDGWFLLIFWLLSQSDMDELYCQRLQMNLSIV
jgi:hypothetical protein